jgi:hypothetical protein
MATVQQAAEKKEDETTVSIDLKRFVTAREAPAVPVSLADRTKSLRLFFADADGRDKAGRFTQYAARTVHGCCDLVAQHKWQLGGWSGPLLKHVMPAARTVWVTLSLSRRTNRWGKEFATIPAMEKAFQARDWPDFFDRFFLNTFYVLDHVTWAHKMGILNNDAIVTEAARRRGLRMAVISWTIALVRALHAVWKQWEKGQDLGTAKRKLLRGFLMFMQGLHNSFVYRMHDAPIGACGIVSSFIDTQDVWRKFRK